MLTATLALIAMAGCAPYRLGSTLPPDWNSIHVKTFENGTGKPKLEFDTTNAAIQEFQKDGTVTVAGAADADLILEARLTRYSLIPLRYESDRPTTAREYRMRLVADVVLKRAATQKVLMTYPGLLGETTFQVTGDLQSDEQNALPLAAKDLAHHIVQSVVEYW
jgi:hypothetical protein